MASPMVSGVVAQLLQKYPEATAETIRSYLTMISLKDVVDMDYFRHLKDSLTPNSMLQVPTTVDLRKNPGTGEGCANICNSVGDCLLKYSPKFYPNEAKELTCHCHQPYGTTNCSSITPAFTGSCGLLDAMVPITFSMLDSYGDGWNEAAFTIIDETTRTIASYAYDSFSYGYREDRSFCLPIGCFILNVAKGLYPSEVGWSLNLLSGGMVDSPGIATRRFCVAGKTAGSTVTTSVTIQCDKGTCTAGR